MKILLLAGDYNKIMEVANFDMPSCESKKLNLFPKHIFEIFTLQVTGSPTNQPASRVNSSALANAKGRPPAPRPLPSDPRSPIYDPPNTPG